MTKSISVLALVTLAACSHSRPANLPGEASLPMAPEGGFLVRNVGNALGYSGAITEKGLEALKASDSGAAHALYIRSSAGDIGAGIQLGEWVHGRGLDVVVVDYCVLACANYVFPAGKHKTILPGAVVAWEGDAHNHFEKDASVAKLRAEEDALFAHLGVSECLTRFGDERTGLDLRRVLSFQRPVGFFTLSAEDMARFGVTDVVGDLPTKSHVNPGVQAWLDLQLVTVPASIDLRTACR